MAYQVIARKWRPQSFAEVVGQEHVTRTLQNAIRSGRVAHAYIFSGVRGVGKTTTARILAKALNCEKGPAAEPCNECARCREIAVGSSLDVMEIDAASNRGIDQIRELREMVRYAPASGRYRVVILDEAHQLTDEASNALLKTLEEPPERVIFVLATTEPEDLPETIRSRAQHFHFRSLSYSEISEALKRVTQSEGLEIEPGAVAVLARAAEGSLRDALSLLEQAIAYCDRKITDAEVRQLLGIVNEESLDELVEAVATGSAERALNLVQKTVNAGENLDSFCREAIRHIRNLLVVRVAGVASDLIAAAADELPRLEQQAVRFSEEDLTRFFQILLMTHADLRRHPDPRIHMEMGLLRMVNAARLTPLEDLMAELRGEATPPKGRTPGSAPPAVPLSGGKEESSRPSGTASGQARRATETTSAPSASIAPASAPLYSPPISRAKPPAVTATASAPRVETIPTAVAGAADERPEPASGVAAAPEVEFEAEGIEPAQVRALQTAVVESQQRFLASLLDHVVRWELESGELRLFFPVEQKALAEMLQTRDPMERLRTLTTQALGQPVRLCVKLVSGRDVAAAAATSKAERSGPRAGSAGDLRAQFEQDPKVRAMIERFGGRISGVKPAGGS